ncbi:MAG: Rpn family recombination-promoting nuclease/putative transposase [Marinospirillum sp.]|uniref:Rpn family recombination-promoting nuclease/putative transposase n=1 Tax=Marinospirillum sp. TaxID=2183934 RepID=UPI0019E2DEB1|nr:Rpn family recombination-promoting nuclease/putative transposase [Marinospirillum sp.]MBE0507290.1 Rpn family recombination-promoting nuclease/putative transposase [Marinospirillum sp.]
MHDSNQTAYSLLDPKNDFVFKRIFTEHPDALVDLINDLRPDLPAITEVEILNPNITPAELEGKHIVLDVLAKDIQGNRYNVEMQVRRYNDWGKRGSFYLAKLLADQLLAGEDYTDLKAAIGIHLLDFDLFTADDQQQQQALWRFEMRDGLQPDVKLGDELQLNLIELKKADRLGLGDQNLKDWITLFEHWKEDGKMAAVTHESVKKVRGYIRELSADEEARRLAFVRERALRDEASQLRYAENEGMVKGEARLLKQLIIKRFDQFPEWAQNKLNTADSAQLEAWADRIFTAETLEALLAD